MGLLPYYILPYIQNSSDPSNLLSKKNVSYELDFQKASPSFIYVRGNIFCLQLSRFSVIWEGGISNQNTAVQQYKHY